MKERIMSLINSYQARVCAAVAAAAGIFVASLFAERVFVAILIDLVLAGAALGVLRAIEDYQLV